MSKERGIIWTQLKRLGSSEVKVVWVLRNYLLKGFLSIRVGLDFSRRDSHKKSVHHKEK